MVESEQDNRKRRRKELQAQIEEKKQEYDRWVALRKYNSYMQIFYAFMIMLLLFAYVYRLQAEYDSLIRVEQEQRELIEQLENNEV